MSSAEEKNVSNDVHNSLAQKNRMFFDSFSETDIFKESWIINLQSQIAEFLSSSDGVSWLGLPSPDRRPEAVETKMLDYACGNGLPSRILKPYFDRCIGIDISAGMLSKYNATAHELGLTIDQMIGVRGDLLTPPLTPTEPPLDDATELHNFDLVTLCMALHHMENPSQAITELARRLKPGGIFLVIDWATTTTTTSAHSVDPDHPAKHTMSRESFTSEEITTLFNQAGCTIDVRFKPADQVTYLPKTEMQLFWARATKG